MNEIIEQPSELKQGLDAIAVSVSRIEPAASMDEVLQSLMLVRFAKQAIAESEAKWKQAAIDWIKANGEIRFGSEKWWVGDSKTTKCIDVRKTVEALLEKTAGDFDHFCTMLSANALKPGACKKLLGDDFKDHFKIEVKEKLETDGSKVDQLQTMNEDFLR